MSWGSTCKFLPSIKPSLPLFLTADSFLVSKLGKHRSCKPAGYNPTIGGSQETAETPVSAKRQDGERKVIRGIQ